MFRFSSVLKIILSKQQKAFYVESYFSNESNNNSAARVSSSLWCPSQGLWGYLKAEVYKDRPRTLEELKHNIRREIGRLPIEMLEKLERNFRNRVHQCIENGGRHLNGVLFETT
jgi:hypothetical protein